MFTQLHQQFCLKELILLGYEVPLYIYFQPSRLESGAIQLKITSFSVGTLTLPESEVLKYLKSSVDLPNFVEVLPKESVININIQNIKTMLASFESDNN